MKPDRATVEAWAASRDRGLTMAPRGLDVDELLEAYIVLLDERDASAKDAARWRALMVHYQKQQRHAGLDHAIGFGDDREMTTAIDAWIERKQKEAKP
jgi:hypothetical protein